MGTSWNTEAIKLYAYQLGKRIARQRVFKVMATTAYCLFNGVKLPNIPEDMIGLAFIAIIQKTDGTYGITRRDSAFTVNSSETCLVFGNTEDYKLENGIWVKGSVSGFNIKIIWANHDVLYQDSVAELGGTVYLPYSDPVPVIE